MDIGSTLMKLGEKLPSSLIWLKVQTVCRRLLVTYTTHKIPGHTNVNFDQSLTAELFMNLQLPIIFSSTIIAVFHSNAHCTVRCTQYC